MQNSGCDILCVLTAVRMMRQDGDTKLASFRLKDSIMIYDEMSSINLIRVGLKITNL